jgi:hypothetical protein
LTFEKVLSLVKKSKKKYWPKNGLTFLQKIIQMKSLRLIAMIVIFRDFMLVNSPGQKDNGLKIFHPSNLKNEIFKVCFQGKKVFRKQNFCFLFYVFLPKVLPIFRENVKDLSISMEKITFCFPLFSAGSELANNHKKLSNLE